MKSAKNLARLMVLVVTVFLGFASIIAKTPIVEQVPYPTGPSERGWRWPDRVSVDGQRLNPPGTFGVLQVWLGDDPIPPKTRSDQIEEVVIAVNQEVEGPITFLNVTWKGSGSELDKAFYKEFLGTDAPPLSGYHDYAADHTQVQVDFEYDNVMQFFLKTINVDGPPPEFTKLQFEVTSDPWNASGSIYTGGSDIHLYVDRNVPASQSQLELVNKGGGCEKAVAFVARVDEGEFWKHWTLFPLYWDKMKRFEPPDDAARAPAGATLFTHGEYLHMVWAAQAFNGDFRVASHAAGDDPTAWTPAGSRREIKSPISGNPVGSYYAPAAAEFKDNIYLSWQTRGNGELRILRSESAEFETQSSHLWKFNSLTATGPALVTVGYKLIVAYRGRGGDVFNPDDDNIYIRETSDGENWSSPRSIATDASNDSSPSLAYLKGRIVLVYKNKARNKIYLKYSDDYGDTWSDVSVVSYGTAYEQGFVSPTLLALSDEDRGGEVLWERPGDLFYLIDSGRATSFTTDQTTFDDLEWRYTATGRGHKYFDYRFFVVAVDRSNDNTLRLCVSPQGSELAVPRL